MDNQNIKEILNMLKDDIYIPSDDNRTYKLLDRDDTRHLLDYITNLQQELIKFQEFKEEHKIMKQILIENGLWERLLNDDRFLKYLRNDEDEQ